MLNIDGQMCVFRRSVLFPHSLTDSFVYVTWSLSLIFLWIFTIKGKCIFKNLFYKESFTNEMNYLHFIYNYRLFLYQRYVLMWYMILKARDSCVWSAIYNLWYLVTAVSNLIDNCFFFELKVWIRNILFNLCRACLNYCHICTYFLRI